MFHHVVNQETFDVVLTRKRNLEHSWYTGVDERIVPSLKVFNELDDVVSLWSCSGHEPNETENGTKKRNFVNSQERYIMFVCNNKDTTTVNLLHEYILDMSRGQWALTRPRLEAIRLNDPADKDRLCNVWKLAFRYLHKTGDDTKDTLRREQIFGLWESMIQYVKEKQSA